MRHAAQAAWLLIVAGTGAAPTGLPGSLTRGHPWTYTVATTRTPGRTVWAFQSTRPVSKDARGKTWLRFHLERRDFADPVAARAAFQQLAANADPNTGLSYAWDYVLLDGPSTWHLSAPCLYSRANVEILEKNLAAEVLGSRPPAATLRCTCGSGCDRMDSVP